jgi:energy-coupling factor transporter ATP-binding protein EcfA2
VTENLFMGRELTRGWGPFRVTDIGQMRRQAVSALEDLNVKIPSVPQEVRRLSGGQRQRVAIGRAVHWGSRVLIMDEPMAALGLQEAGRVQELVMRLSERGLTQIIVSHNLDHVFTLSTRIAVMRLGRLVDVRPTVETDHENRPHGRQAGRSLWRPQGGLARARRVTPVDVLPVRPRRCAGRHAQLVVAGWRGTRRFGRTMMATRLERTFGWRTRDILVEVFGIAPTRLARWSPRASTTNALGRRRCAARGRGRLVVRAALAGHPVGSQLATMVNVELALDAVGLAARSPWSRRRSGQRGKPIPDRNRRRRRPRVDAPVCRLRRHGPGIEAGLAARRPGVGVASVGRPGYRAPDLVSAFAGRRPADVLRSEAGRPRPTRRRSAE